VILQRRSDARGHVHAGCIDSRHAFSTGDYYDPQWMGFGPLRVFSEVTLAPGAGLPPQRYANMELLTYVLSGALALGTGDADAVNAGELSWDGAGHGIELQLRNASAERPVRFLQAWLQPDRLNARPDHARLAVDVAQRRARWTTLASPDGGEGSLAMHHQQAWLRGALLAADESVGLALDPGRRYWLHVVQGGLRVDGRALAAGDALGIAEETGMLRIIGASEAIADLLLFDLPA
jgi:redox-sensitive bicupin YhaK (pirin superfamily)